MESKAVDTGISGTPMELLADEFIDSWRDAQFPYYWRVRTRLPERFGQPCRVLIRSKMNSALVEFEDGFKVVTSRNYVRKRGILPN